MKSIISTFRFGLLSLGVLILLAGVTNACRSSKKTPTKPKPRPTAPRPSGQSSGSAPAPAPKKDAPLEQDKNSRIAFFKSNRLMPVLEEATKQNKPVFVEFFAPWCGPCKTLEKEVFNAPEVARYVNENFVSVKINTDTDDGKAVAQLYNASSLPTMLFLDKKGNELKRLVGTTTPSLFIAAGNSALSK
jgi:thiol:disulfide interchange protein